MSISLPKRHWLLAVPLLLLVLMLALASPTQAQPNLVVNGDFEQPDISNCSLFVPVPKGSAFITGWNVNIPSSGSANGGCDSNPGFSQSVDLVVQPGGPFVNTGSQSVDMAGTSCSPPCSIFQDLATVPGQTFTLTFFTSSNREAKANALTVRWDGNPLATISTTALGTWVQHTFSVTASGATTRLEFVGNISGVFGALLDTVSLVTQEVPFATLTIREAKVTFGPASHRHDRFKVKGTFVLGETSEGIDPLDEAVVVTVGTASVTIPAGSFVAVGSKVKFKGVIPETGVKVKMELKETDPKVFKFKVKVKGVDLTDTANPVEITLRIGDDSGMTSERLEGKLKLEEKDEGDDDDDEKDKDKDKDKDDD